MLKIRRSDERGRADFGWLDSRHTFSFGQYHDPRHMGFGALRVINEDRVAPGGGFDPHAHRDMEILSYVLEGALEHRDSMGNVAVIRPGELQRMSAGTGVRHSEYNASKDEPVHFLQIWVIPERQGLEPGYEQRAFSASDTRGAFKLIGSRDGREGSVTIHQDVDLLLATLGAGEEVSYATRPGRKLWVQATRGAVAVNGEALAQGDAAAVVEESGVTVSADADAEVLLFDLA